MGLGNNDHATYLNISNGKICKTLKNPSDKSVERINKNNKTVHEEFYDHVSGVITSITTKENEYGKFWMVGMEDDGDRFVLQMNYSSGYSSAFLKILPNVDFSKPVAIIPSMKIEGDKKKVSLFISQNGNPLKHFYTKDNPNGLPQMTQKKIKGKLSWDDSEMMEFLEAMVENEVKPKLNGELVSDQSDEEPMI